MSIKSSCSMRLLPLPWWNSTSLIFCAIFELSNSWILLSMSILNQAMIVYSVPCSKLQTQIFQNSQMLLFLLTEIEKSTRLKLLLFFHICKLWNLCRVCNAKTDNTNTYIYILIHYILFIITGTKYCLLKCFFSTIELSTHFCLQLHRNTVIQFNCRKQCKESKSNVSG